jgi:hypothetical protein
MINSGSICKLKWDSVKLYSNGVYIFHKYVFSDFAYRIYFDVYSLQLQMHWYEIVHAAEYKNQKLFLFCFFKYSLHRKKSQIKVVDLNPICIFCSINLCAMFFFFSENKGRLQMLWIIT